MAWIARRLEWNATFVRVLGFACLGSMLALGSGCAILEKCSFVVPKDGVESVSHIDMAFSPSVFMVDDTIHPGMTVPCLKGRVYLMSDSKQPIVGRGFIVAELYDMTKQVPGVPPERIAAWEFKPAAMKMAQANDKIGVGYTLFLPFVEYTPALKKAFLRVIYVDENGEARENNSTLMLRVAQDESAVQINNLRNVPAAFLPTR